MQKEDIQNNLINIGFYSLDLFEKLPIKYLLF